jgi:hypothetical protein
VIFPVFPERARHETEGHHQENNSSYFEPKLVGGARESSQSCANRALYRAERAAAAGSLAGIVPGNTRRYAQLLERRNFAHGLDFNSLGRYNDATCADSKHGL